MKIGATRSEETADLIVYARASCSDRRQRDESILRIRSGVFAWPHFHS
jgi:hypothetical protein